MPRRSIASLRYINQEALTGSLCWLDRERTSKSNDVRKMTGEK
jgi:hypothetical protein